MLFPIMFVGFHQIIEIYCDCPKLSRNNLITQAFWYSLKQVHFIEIISNFEQNFKLDAPFLHITS